MIVSTRIFTDPAGLVESRSVRRGAVGRSGKSHRVPRPGNAQEGRGLSRLGVCVAYALVRPPLVFDTLTTLMLSTLRLRSWRRS